MKYRTILMFGPPGSGKGTHGKILGSIPGFYHCACGDVFRDLRADTELGKVFIDYSSRGKLVPDEPTIALWRKTIDASTHLGRFHPATDTLVLDGIPRNVLQAEILNDTLDVVAVFYLSSANKKNLIARLQRRALKDNRLDDANLDVIRQRLKTYEKDTRPVLNYYGKTLVHSINTDETPIATFLKILQQVAKFEK
jgi:adenylate kinase